MGFGYLLVGYILSFVFSLGNVYFFQDVIGALVMMIGLSRLALHGKNFYRAMWVDIGYLVISAIRVFLMMFDMLDASGIVAMVFNILLPLVSLVLQFFLFAGIYYLALEVELEREAQKARGSLVRIFSYYILYVIAYLLTPGLGNTVGNIVGLVVTVYGLIVLIMNVVLLHTCYCRICLSGQETGESPRSRYEWVNKMNEKVDAMFDGAFVRTGKKNAPKEAEEPEPGYLRVKRKKKGKHK